MSKLISLILVFGFVSSTIFASKYYEKAERMFNMVEYDQALDALEDAISREDNNKKTLIKIYYLKAKIYAILGKEKNAKKQFVKLLFLDNEYNISEDESPKIVNFFKQTQKKFLESLTVKLEKPEIIFDAVKKTDYKKRIPIKAMISSMNESRNAKIFYRNIGTSKYFKADLDPVSGDNFAGNIPMPLDANRNFAVEYYIGVLNFSGDMIAHYPSAEEPIIISVTFGDGSNSSSNSNEISSDDGILGKWWFWTVVGVVVVGAGAGVYAATK